VHHAGELLGMLRLQEHDHQPLSPVEERLFTGLAAQAGLVLHGSRLRAELARRAAELSARAAELRLSRERLVDTQDAERRRLERDIHDGAQQHLVALAVNLRLAEVLAARSAERAEHILADQRDATRVTIETLVDLSRGIYPRALTEQGVVAALESAASRSAVPVEIRADGVGRYAPDVEAAVYFCCLEALQNAAKHSGASQVVVDLRETAARLDFCVSDDGRGFDEAPGDRGAGLRNMRDRVDSVGGHIALERSPAGGARISGSVPVVDRLAAAGPTR
jgi:signal transduction histidine kinase